MHKCLEPITNIENKWNQNLLYNLFEVRFKPEVDDFQSPFGGCSRPVNIFLINEKSYVPKLKLFTSDVMKLRTIKQIVTYRIHTSDEFGLPVTNRSKWVSEVGLLCMSIRLFSSENNSFSFKISTVCRSKSKKLITIDVTASMQRIDHFTKVVTNLTKLIGIRKKLKNQPFRTSFSFLNSISLTLWTPFCGTFSNLTLEKEVNSDFTSFPIFPTAAKSAGVNPLRLQSNPGSLSWNICTLIENLKLWRLSWNSCWSKYHLHDKFKTL